MIRLKEAISVKRRSKREKCKVEANLDPRRGKTKKWYEMRTSFYFLFFALSRYGLSKVAFSYLLPFVSYS